MACALEPGDGGSQIAIAMSESEPGWQLSEALESALRDLPEPAAALRVVTLSEFAEREEATAASVLGSDAEPLLPLGGMLLMYGDGGAGKTTLTIDAVAHLASGIPWLGIEVPRPVRCLLVENEGPRGRFRRRLAEKRAAWPHGDLAQRVWVLEEPWGALDLRREEQRAELAQVISELELDLVVMGPLVTLGMTGGGTPDEVSAFEALLQDVESSCSQPFAWWIVHHENKQGDVSGAWERVPDCLCHVQSQGPGHTRIYLRKARWADSLHARALDLVWTEGRSFARRERPERDLHAEILGLFAEADRWLTAREVASELRSQLAQTRQALTDLVERGELACTVGPPGRAANARCYRSAQMTEREQLL